MVCTVPIMPASVDLPVVCPVCGVSTVERIFSDFAMTMKGPVEKEPAENKNVSIAAFICRTNGHVFFVRGADLQERFEPTSM